MKQFLTTVFLLSILSFNSFSQSTEILPGQVVPHMTTSQRISLSTPQDGTLVFDSDTQSYWARLSGSWVEFLATGGSIGDWSLSGNAGNEIKNNNAGGFWSANPTGLVPFSFAAPTSPVDGNGTRLMWIPQRSAFRVGTIYNNANTWNADSIGTFSFAAGLNTLAKGAGSTAFGENNTATGSVATVLGLANKASGSYSFSVGQYNLSSGTSSAAFGQATHASGTNSFAAGRESKAIGREAISLGYLSEANGTGSIALGHQSLASGLFSYALGDDAEATSDNSMALGFGTKAQALFATAIGTSTTASNTYAFATGFNTTASGEAASTFGDLTVASGNRSTAMGWQSQALGVYATATGWSTTAQGSHSFSTGKSSLASGEGAFTSGNSTEAAGFGSAALGSNSKALGNYSFSVGINSEARQESSIAMGNLALAIGKAAVSLGTFTKSIGDYSITSGLSTKAKGIGSAAFGINTISEIAGSLAIGTYNDTTALSSLVPRVFQVGNGSLGSRSNAFTVLSDSKTGINTALPLAGLHIKSTSSNWERHIRLDYTDTEFGNILYDFDGMKFRVRASGDAFYFRNSTNQNLMRVYESGNVTIDGTLTELSDKRYKKDIALLSNSSKRIAKINGYNYSWKNETKDKSLQTGLIAQEVREVFPELVKEDKEGMLSVNYTGFIPHLIESTKELKTENKQLLQRLNDLENELNEIKSMIMASSK